MDFEFALAIHVLSIVLWIGGVGFVTTVALPAIRRSTSPLERLERFEWFERRFAWQARGWVLIAGLSGLYMVARLDLWRAFEQAAYWWLDAMIGLWFIFALMLFVAEPFFLHRWLARRSRAKPEQTFRLVERMHWLLLSLSIVTVLSAVAGSHGG